MSSPNTSAPSAAPEKPYTEIPAPPHEQFETQEELLLFMRNFSHQHGFAFVKDSSHPEKKSYVYRCNQGRKIRQSSENSDKAQRSIKSNCPFKFSGSYHQKLEKWLINYNTKNSRHNHGPSEGPHTHPVNRRLSKEDLVVVEQMFDAGATPANIKQTLMKQHGGKIYQF